MGMARRHLAWDKPLLVMDWPSWLPWWLDRQPFSYKEHGQIIFSTHVYGAFGVKGQQEVRDAFANDLDLIAEFYTHSRYKIVVSEYAVSRHGPGDPRRDPFEYHSLANWYVHQFNQHGIGSAVWNFDAGKWVRAWGPVALNQVGMHPIHWREIFSVAAPLPSHRIHPNPAQLTPFPPEPPPSRRHRAVELAASYYYLLMPLLVGFFFLCGCRNLRAWVCGCFKAPPAGTLMVSTSRCEETLSFKETAPRLEAPLDEERSISVSTEEEEEEEPPEYRLLATLAPIDEQSHEDDESGSDNASAFWSTML